MGKDHRVTWRRHHSYHTKSNLFKVVKTPGGVLKLHKRRKHTSGPKCGDCKVVLPGLKATRPAETMRLSKPKKTVARAYGGSRCAGCVRNRIIRAFLVEEQKIVKKVLKEAAKKDSSKPKKSKK